MERDHPEFFGKLKHKSPVKEKINLVFKLKNELKQKWTDVLWEMAEGRAQDFEVLRRKDVFEFFAVLKAYRNRVKKLIPKATVKGNG